MRVAGARTWGTIHCESHAGEYNGTWKSRDAMCANASSLSRLRATGTCLEGNDIGFRAPVVSYQVPRAFAQGRRQEHPPPSCWHAAEPAPQHAAKEGKDTASPHCRPPAATVPRGPLPHLVLGVVAALDEAARHVGRGRLVLEVVDGAGVGVQAAANHALNQQLVGHLQARGARSTGRK